MRRARIVLLPGDGIGAEVTAAARTVLEAVADAAEFDLVVEEALIGGAALSEEGTPLPAATLKLCRKADAVLLGAVGGPAWEDAPPRLRPEQGLLDLRRGLELFANIRPVTPFPRLHAASPLRPERLVGVDLVVVRELTGGIYFGEKTHEWRDGEEHASDLCAYAASEVERVTRVAASLARARRGLLTSVDKANVLETSRLWRRVVTRVVEREFPDVRLEHLLVDACAMHLIQRPQAFDVIVTENMFGDILTDEASVLAGSIGMLPSASLGDGSFGLYEPIHGSAPGLAGLGVANPIGAILSLALLLRHSLGQDDAAKLVEAAVEDVVDEGVLTPDVAGETAVTTREVAAGVADRVSRSASAATRGSPRSASPSR